MRVAIASREIEKIMLSEFPTLKTPRLLLRAIHQSDVQLVHRNFSDSQTVLYSNAPAPSLEKVQPKNYL